MKGKKINFSKENQELIREAFGNPYQNMIEEWSRAKPSWANCASARINYAKGVVAHISDDPAFNPDSKNRIMESLSRLSDEVRENQEMKASQAASIARRIRELKKLF